MDEPSLFGSAPDRTALNRNDTYLRIVAEGRRRLRRRRLSVGGAAFLLVAASAVTAGVASRGADRPTRLVTAPPPIVPAVCRPGGIVEPGVARTGSSVRFGVLPAGYHLGSDPTGAEAESVGPPQRLGVGLQPIDPNSRFTPRATTPNTTVAGHLATLTASTPLGAAMVVWRPDPATELNVTSSGGISTAALLQVANGVIYQPGARAGAVGDVGRVISRASAIADSDAVQGSTTQIITWLVTNQELTAALPAMGETPTGEAEQGAPPSRPLWVIAEIGTYRNNTEESFGNGPNGGSAHIEETVVDGVTGFPFLTEIAGDATVGAGFASLTDHSLRQTCPSPSSTNPNSLPPRHEPAASTTTGPAITATARPAPADSTNLIIEAGTAQGVAEGDTVTATSGSGASQLVGTITDIAANTSTVSLITANSSAIPVALDGAGNDAVLIGQGPNRPLRAELVNRSVHLATGTRLISTGPPHSPVAGGLLVGTVTLATTQNDLPLVLVTPSFTAASLGPLTVSKPAPAAG